VDGDLAYLIPGRRQRNGHGQGVLFWEKIQGRPLPASVTGARDRPSSKGPREGLPQLDARYHEDVKRSLIAFREGMRNDNEQAAMNAKTELHELTKKS